MDLRLKHLRRTKSAARNLIHDRCERWRSVCHRLGAVCMLVSDTFNVWGEVAEEEDLALSNDIRIRV